MITLKIDILMVIFSLSARGKTSLRCGTHMVIFLTISCCLPWWRVGLFCWSRGNVFWSLRWCRLCRRNRLKTIRYRLQSEIKKKTYFNILCQYCAFCFGVLGIFFWLGLLSPVTPHSLTFNTLTSCQRHSTTLNVENVKFY
jgi:hypothetical protein